MRNEPVMTPNPIILATINARYSHTAFGLRSIWANLGELRERTSIREFHIKQEPGEIAAAILRNEPVLAGLGVYIWNAGIVTGVVKRLKAARPDLPIVLGGPEVSYEYEGTPLFALCDYLVRGEGEAAFPRLARCILAGEPPASKVIEAPVEPAKLALPYDTYTQEDIAHRLVYAETSRGCPYRCEFCLSSLEPGVREFPLAPWFEAVERLLERGVRHIKFVDRTFNLSQERVDAVFAFFQARWREGMQLHLEILPDRLTPRTLEQMAQFPEGGLHLEVGVQTFNPETQEAISRRQDLDATGRNLRFLREQTGAILHADLVAGLPMETWDSFADGFDRLLALGPHKVQVGILKRLKGAPIVRHERDGRLTFSKRPPYEVLSTGWLPAGDVARLKRFARYFGLFHNSGNFPRSLPLLWRTHPSPFRAFIALSERIWRETQRTYRFPLVELMEHLYIHLTAPPAGFQTIPVSEAAAAIRADYYRLPGRKDRLNVPKTE